MVQGLGSIVEGVVGVYFIVGRMCDLGQTLAVYTLSPRHPQETPLGSTNQRRDVTHDSAGIGTSTE